MNIRNCVKCNRIFNYIGGQPICPSCREKQEVEFKTVKEFIKENPKAGINEVAELCEVNTQQIRQWIREERLSFSEDSVIGIDCERCGKSIKTGRFCGECLVELKGGFNAGLHKEPENEFKNKQTDNKMRFFNKE